MHACKDDNVLLMMIDMITLASIITVEDIIAVIYRLNIRIGMNSIFTFEKKKIKFQI